MGFAQSLWRSVGPDGKIYFGQGTVTNSGVVGPDNEHMVAWSSEGKLYATENGLDVRGSRPIANDKEDLYEIKHGAWYGWPDYASGIPVTDPQFAPKDGPKPEFIMTEHPPVEKPIVTFPKHSAVTKLAVSPGGRFAPKGQLLIAFFGHMSPITGETGEHGGHRVALVDPKTKTVKTFFGKKEEGMHAATEKQGANEPTGRTGKSQKAEPHEGHAQGGEKDESVSPGPRRLMDVLFSADGNALYVVDFGAMVAKDRQPLPVPGSGVIWRVVPNDSPEMKPHAGLNAKGVR